MDMIHILVSLLLSHYINFKLLFLFLVLCLQKFTFLFSFSCLSFPLLCVSHVYTCLHVCTSILGCLQILLGWPLFFWEREMSSYSSIWEALITSQWFSLNFIFFIIYGILILLILNFLYFFFFHFRWFREGESSACTLLFLLEALNFDSKDWSLDYFKNYLIKKKEWIWF